MRVRAQKRGTLARSPRDCRHYNHHIPRRRNTHVYFYLPGNSSIKRQPNRSPKVHVVERKIHNSSDDGINEFLLSNTKLVCRVCVHCVSAMLLHGFGEARGEQHFIQIRTQTLAERSVEGSFFPPFCVCVCVCVCVHGRQAISERNN